MTNPTKTRLVVLPGSVIYLFWRLLVQAGTPRKIQGALWSRNKKKTREQDETLRKIKSYIQLEASSIKNSRTPIINNNEKKKEQN